MADITDPGATGRKGRGSGASAPAAGQDAPPAGADPALAAGTAPTATAQVGAVGGDAVIVAGGLGDAASALGIDPDARVIDVDPGVGASQRAVETEGFRPVEPGPAIAAPLSADERAELEDLRRRYAGLPTNREELTTLRAAQVGSAVAVAPAGELRFATAATQILRGGRTYRPHDEVPVDLEGYAELREIGAITATRWERLPLADEA